MSSLLWAGLGFVGVALLFLLKLLEPLLQKDLEEGIPWLAAWLVRRAARKLPAKHRQRFEEEWLAELAAVPGVMVFKLHFAAGVSFRARSTSRAMQNLPPWWEEILRRLAHVTARAIRKFNSQPRHRYPDVDSEEDATIESVVLIGDAKQEPPKLDRREQFIQEARAAETPRRMSRVERWSWSWRYRTRRYRRGEQPPYGAPPWPPPRVGKDRLE